MTKGKYKTMVEIRDVIYRLRNGQSNRCIHREIGVDRSIIKRIKELAIIHLWLDIASPMPSDEEIAKKWYSKSKSQKSHPLTPYHESIKQWHEQGLSAVVMQRLLKDKYHGDVQVIRRYLNKYFPKPVEVVMVRPTVPGQDMEIDFGYLGQFLNDEGTLKKAWFFSFRLRHSRRTFRRVVLDQTIETFLLCHVEAFEWFGGVPKNVIIDNCKAAIIQCTIDNEMVRRSYQELAEHYGFIISPCLPRTPEHKGGVEADVKYVKISFVPYFRAKQKEKNIEISSLRDVSEGLEIWGNEVDDVHIVYGVGKSPLVLFNTEEKKALQPLPKSRWEITSWSKSTVRKDWTIMHEGSRYSVPYQLVDQVVQVRTTTSSVRVFFDHKEVAFHERANEKWDYKRKTEHAPPLQEEVLQCSREGLLAMAEKAGHYIHQVADGILSHPAVDKLRPVRLLLKLANKYSQERLEKACQRAFHYKIFTYAGVKNILENNLDKEVIDAPPPSKIIPLNGFRFARNPTDYKIIRGERESFEEKVERMHPVSKHGNAMAGISGSIMADNIIEEEMQRLKKVSKSIPGET